MLFERCRAAAIAASVDADDPIPPHSTAPILPSLHRLFLPFARSHGRRPRLTR